MMEWFEGEPGSGEFIVNGSLLIVVGQLGPIGIFKPNLTRPVFWSRGSPPPTHYLEHNEEPEKLQVSLYDIK